MLLPGASSWEWVGSMTSSSPVTDRAPVPLAATSIDDLVAALRGLRGWAGNPSYATLAKRVAQARLARGVPPSEATPGRVTVYDCFREGRRRLDSDLVISLVAVLGADREAQAVWRQAIRRVLMPGAGPVQAEAVLHPAPPEAFVGRERALAELARLLDGSGVGAVVLDGMPGAGKTSLAVRAAHDLSARLGAPDPVLVNLRGFSADRQPVDPDSVADALLRALSPGEVPVAGQRFAALQALLAREPVVLILDNAATADQVAPLLPPPGGPSRALVTTRQQLPGLDRGVRRLQLGALDPAGAREVLIAAAGQPLPDDAAVEGLARLAGYLPLALSLMGRRVAARPDWPLGDHLASYRERLDRLQLDDGVEVALGVSYAALAEGDRHVLRACARHPGQTFGADAVAALTDTAPTGSTPDSGDATTDGLRPALDRLVAASLLRETGRDRWELHDLVRTFAAARSVEEDAPSTRNRATRRLCDRYLEQATEAVAALHPQAVDDWGWVDRAELTPWEVGEARDWLDAERVNLLACAGWASRHRVDLPAVRFAAVLAHDLWQRGDVETTLEVHRAAIASAAALDDAPGEALAHRNTGNTLLRAGRFEPARPHLDQALRLFQTAGHPGGEQSTLSSLAILASAIGDQAGAIDTFRRLVARLRTSEEPGERLAIALSNLAVALIRDDRRAEGLALLEESAELAARHGWAERERNALSNMAYLLVEHGRPQEGLDAAERALELSEEADDPVSVGYARSNLGVVLEHLGRRDEADQQWRAALAAGRSLDSPELVASVLNHIGDGHRGRGDLEGARTAYEQALAVAEEIAEATETARAREGLAAVSDAVADPVTDIV
ncbi:tetratricopeptide (TPR) repeat protein [Ornithinicoccus hortensis]|uniref:Tetratricopeptide (TPR) repeat protein n=2 Tax=Ornithinicoccus hortensis TaxID=82346 RepID=A0A542YNS2_9MICO|nr:tetratricopeptide (TPR) repeat protein [Ornithinicoccus hortensis]